MNITDKLYNVNYTLRGGVKLTLSISYIYIIKSLAESQNRLSVRDFYLPLI